jgi:hypothetical protein
MNFLSAIVHPFMQSYHTASALLRHPQAPVAEEVCPSLLLQPGVKLLIAGKFQDSRAREWIDVTNPVSGESASLRQLYKPAGYLVPSGYHDVEDILVCKVSQPGYLCDAVVYSLLSGGFSWKTVFPAAICFIQSQAFIIPQRQLHVLPKVSFMDFSSQPSKGIKDSLHKASKKSLRCATWLCFSKDSAKLRCAENFLVPISCRLLRRSSPEFRTPQKRSLTRPWPLQRKRFPRGGTLPSRCGRASCSTSRS